MFNLDSVHILYTSKLDNSVIIKYNSILCTVETTKYLGSMNLYYLAGQNGVV